MGTETVEIYYVKYFYMSIENDIFLLLTWSKTEVKTLSNLVEVLYSYSSLWVARQVERHLNRVAWAVTVV